MKIARNSHFVCVVNYSKVYVLGSHSHLVEILNILFSKDILYDLCVYDLLNEREQDS